MISPIFKSLSSSNHLEWCINLVTCDMSQCSNQVLSISSSARKNLLGLLLMIIQLGCDRCYVQESVCCDQMEVVRISSDAAQSQRKVVKSVWCLSCKVFPLQDRKTLIFKTLLHWIFDLTKYPSQPCIWWAAGQTSYSTLIFECSWPSNLKSLYFPNHIQ